MFWFMWVVGIALVVGVLARAIVPGRSRIGCLGTIVVGWLGSFVGGFLGNLIGSGSIFDVRRAGILGSIVGAAAEPVQSFSLPVSAAVLLAALKVKPVWT